MKKINQNSELFGNETPAGKSAPAVWINLGIKTQNAEGNVVVTKLDKGVPVDPTTPIGMWLIANAEAALGLQLVVTSVVDGTKPKEQAPFNPMLG